MKNKHLKFLVLTAILLIITSIIVSAAGVTHFVMNYAQNGEKISVNVQTDCVTGVGGMDFALNFDNEAFELDEGSVRCSLPSCEMVIKENMIRVLWDTTEKETLPNILISADFISKDETSVESGMYFSINDYYDNSLELNDLPYEVSYLSADSVERAKLSGLPIVVTVLLVIIAVIVVSAAAYWFLTNRKIEEIARNIVKSSLTLEAV
ncbi:MAG: hypothetical protein IJP22_02600 [Clostridia bacterium]|nr:hypothetical protein [Clostridia bacterium]